MKIQHTIALAASLLLAQNAFADVVAVAQKANCLGCHQENQKRFGPSFKEIADKYRGDKSAAAMLEKKIRDGGKGNWGKVAMPPTAATVSDADIKDLAQWILSTK
ncbi:MAG: c-type cytochrome [Gallionellaceae bacterium]|jgi:cytochrome c|nr:c-type cytochrome [Gallionellaceae bacterium]